MKLNCESTTEIYIFFGGAVYLYVTWAGIHHYLLFYMNFDPYEC